ncbi:hypothetical protein ABIB90_003165 [Bradyrhizobium sp. JR4.1]
MRLFQFAASFAPNSPILFNANAVADHAPDDAKYNSC